MHVSSYHALFSMHFIVGGKQIVMHLKESLLQRLQVKLISYNYVNMMHDYAINRKHLFAHDCDRLVAANLKVSQRHAFARTAVIKYLQVMFDLDKSSCR